MARARKSLFLSLGALVVMAAFWGCNGSDIDDPANSDSVLVIDGVTPASVQADVSPDLDPNGVLAPKPPKDDVVSVDVRNLNRTQTPPSAFGDILITSFDVSCDTATVLTSFGNPASVTVPAGTSASLSVVVAPGPVKQANAGALLALLTDTCTIVLKGEDLSGERVRSKEAVVRLSFVDTP